MRGFFFLLATVSVIALAGWAYNENYKTTRAIKRVDKLQTQIGDAQEYLAVLKAEWAYLNRPDRLRDLADLNFDGLMLMPLTPAHFGELDFIGFAPEPRLRINNPIDVQGTLKEVSE